MSAELARKVADWLFAMPSTYFAEARCITIGGETFYGASYFQICYYEAGMDGVTRGTHYVGQGYVREGIYLIGSVPKSYKKRQKTVYVFENDSDDYYISSYMDEAHMSDNNKEFHPFGVCFILAPWSFAEKIDHYEDKPYTRVPALINPL